MAVCVALVIAVFSATSTLTARVARRDLRDTTAVRMEPMPIISVPIPTSRSFIASEHPEHREDHDDDQDHERPVEQAAVHATGGRGVRVATYWASSHGPTTIAAAHASSPQAIQVEKVSDRHVAQIGRASCREAA